MRHRLFFGSLALSLLGASFFLYRGRGAAHAVKLIKDGGVRRLRPRLRPIKPGPRLVLFAFDGVGADELYEAIHAGRCPHLGALLGAAQRDGLFEHGYAVAEALSILPSTTMAAWASIFSGAPPACTGVPGNEWFVREEARFYAPAPVSVTEIADTLRMLADGLVGDAIRVPTLFEQLNRRAHVSLAPVYRGADLFTYTDPSVLAELFGAVARGAVGESSVKQEVYQELDQNSVEALLKAIAEDGTPELQVIYFPGIDLFSHIAAAPLSAQPDYLETILDPAIGQVIEAYRRARVLAQTYVLIVADHGHTPVLNDDRHSLHTIGDHEPPALLERLGFRVRPFNLELPQDSRHTADYNAVVAYQGAMAYIYLADRSGNSAAVDWRRPPRFEEDVMAVVRGFDRVNRTGEPIAQLRGTLDLIFARAPRPVGADALPFEVFDGERLVAINAYLERHQRPDLLRLEARMRGLAAGPYGHRAGDVLLLARSGMEVPIENRFYFSGPYRSWHGSPTRQDSHVPLIVAHPGRSGAELKRWADDVIGAEPSHLHVVPLVLKALGAAPHRGANRFGEGTMERALLR